MPTFSYCCPGYDEYVCQGCGGIKCGGCKPSVWKEGRGNMCSSCIKSDRGCELAEAKLKAQELFADQKRIYDDACDVGIRIDAKAGRKELLRASVTEMIKTHKPKIIFWFNGRTYDFGSFEISWCLDKSRKIEFLCFTAK